jgi:hypothetical protein
MCDQFAVIELETSDHMRMMADHNRGASIDRGAHAPFADIGRLA